MKLCQIWTGWPLTWMLSRSNRVFFSWTTMEKDGLQFFFYFSKKNFDFFLNIFGHFFFPVSFFPNFFSTFSNNKFFQFFSTFSNFFPIFSSYFWTFFLHFFKYISFSIILYFSKKNSDFCLNIFGHFLSSFSFFRFFVILSNTFSFQFLFFNFCFSIISDFFLYFFIFFNSSFQIHFLFNFLQNFTVYNIYVFFKFFPRRKLEKVITSK